MPFTRARDKLQPNIIRCDSPISYLAAQRLRTYLAYPILAVAASVALSKLVTAGFGTEMVLMPLWLVAYLGAVTRRDDNRLSLGMQFVLPLLIVLTRIDYFPLTLVIAVAGLFFPSGVWRSSAYRI